MRVLSQNGTINMPFDHTTFMIYRQTVQGSRASCMEDVDLGWVIEALEIGKVVARYKTSGEAVDALQAVENAYFDYKEVVQFT